MSDPRTYYFVAASRHFLCVEEPLGESLKERLKNYEENKKEIDFWLVEQPAFLNAPSLNAQCKSVPRPAAAVISTDPQVVRWLKLRLEFVVTGEFLAPTDEIPDPFATSPDQ